VKKVIPALIPMVFIMWSAKARAQWIPSFRTPTAAEIQVYDLPHTILQEQINSNLLSEDWEASSSFPLLKSNPNDAVIAQGNGIHKFLVAGESVCNITLRQSSSMYKPIQDSSELISKKLVAGMQDAFALADKAMAAAKNGGKYKYSADEMAQLRKDSSQHIQGMIALAHIHNLTHILTFALSVNAYWISGETHSNAEHLKSDFKILKIPGVKFAFLRIDFPDKEHPDISPDTSYNLSLYIGNWPKPSLDKTLPYPFKYDTKYAWIDVEHSGPPIIENFVISIISYHYNWLMKAVNAIDCTKLEALTKK